MAVHSELRSRVDDLAITSLWYRKCVNNFLSIHGWRSVPRLTVLSYSPVARCPETIFSSICLDKIKPGGTRVFGQRATVQAWISFPSSLKRTGMPGRRRTHLECFLKKFQRRGPRTAARGRSGHGPAGQEWELINRRNPSGVPVTFLVPCREFLILEPSS